MNGYEIDDLWMTKCNDGRIFDALIIRNKEHGRINFHKQAHRFGSDLLNLASLFLYGENLSKRMLKCSSSGWIYCKAVKVENSEAIWRMIWQEKLLE